MTGVKESLITESTGTETKKSVQGSHSVNIECESASSSFDYSESDTYRTESDARSDFDVTKLYKWILPFIFSVYLVILIVFTIITLILRKFYQHQ
ncbi:unnamed protein product [Hymenolepis diminuta]|uniref:Uncharacterized protein n=1 Tax=Hymenolepis diminuta TaxID=6216 RepID=A0A564YS52_HYMDI|nr:unnamed protein product [Hymenolepis diminuta]